jgi:hypothetical protein
MPLDEARRQMDERITLRGGDDDLRLRADHRPWTRFALLGGFLLLVACAALVVITLAQMNTKERRHTCRIPRRRSSAIVSAIGIQSVGGMTPSNLADPSTRRSTAIAAGRIAIV